MEASMVEPGQITFLIQRASGGDREAFDELVAPFSERLLKRIRQRMGPGLGRKVEPEDVLQETLFRAFRSIGHFRWQGQNSFQAWLEGIAVNFVLHSARGQLRRREFRITRDPEAPGVSPSRHERERFERLQECVNRLSPDHRTVIRLSRIEGLKVREIADRMGRSPSAVKNLLLRAMKELRSSFGDTESLGLPDRELRGGGSGDGK
jgi:RNA polymerase sigma-70 factor (ECF subfamily)